MKRRQILTGGIGAIVVGGLLLTGCGSGGDPAVQAQSSGVIDLSGVTPNWDKALPAASRSVKLAAFNNDAVRDNNTGLVWELSPKTTPQNWSLARFACAQSTVGGQRGWRLPFLPELASLLDPSVPFGALALPPGHPFTNVLPDYYWSASTVADLSSAVWVVQLNDGISAASTLKTRSWQVWCVRGGMNADTY